MAPQAPGRVCAPQMVNLYLAPQDGSFKSADCSAIRQHALNLPVWAIQGVHQRMYLL